jgi:hypothetical protein
MQIINNLEGYLQAQISWIPTKPVEKVEVAPPLRHFIANSKTRSRGARFKKSLEPTTGIEPVTCRLRIDCSTS